MISSPEEDESPSGEHELEAKKPPSRGPWDPFSYLRKTISPAQRLELLRLEVPVLPPEDFMDTADFKRERQARLRRWWPALLGLAALLLAVAFASIWLRRAAQVAPRDVNTTAMTSSPRTGDSAMQELAASSRPAVVTSLPAAPTASAAQSSRPAQVQELPEGKPKPALAPTVDRSSPRSLGTTPRPASVVKAEQQPARVPPVAPPEPASNGNNFWTKPR